MSLRLILGGLLIGSFCWASEGSSPVVLWTLKRIGGGHVESNLNEFTPKQFADLVGWKSEHGNVPVIAFGLKSLSLEDLSAQGGMGSSEPFRKLRRLTDASAETLLFPAVQSASDSLTILQSKGFDVIEINAGDPLPNIDKPNTIILVMEKPNVNMDDEILRVFSKYTLDYPNLVGMLWGKQSTWSEEPEDDSNNEILTRRKRQAANTTTPFTFCNKDLIMYLKAVKLTVTNGQKSVSNTCGATQAVHVKEGANAVLTIDVLCTGGSLSTKEFKIKMTFTELPMKYYKLANATVTLATDGDIPISVTDEALRSALELTVPKTWSYHCSSFGALTPIAVNPNGSFSIVFQEFQIEAFWGGNCQAEKPAFSTEYECVGFFTPGIWCGIVVTLMLLSILTWGMKMLMDVKTMDRFDDPKGKPISFGSGE